jgi:antitoxin MazE
MRSDKETNVAKWGNSTGIRIPKTVADKAGLRESDLVAVKAEGPGVIVVRVVTERPTLQNLVSRITPENRHCETNWGDPRGHEIW